MKKVVVIEDEPQMRKNLVRILELERFRTYAAEDGLSGIDLIDKQKPDLILCDIAMPRLDGFGVLEKLRASKKNHLIPFIFLTSRGEKGDMRTGMALGADDYLTKPFTPEDLLKAINSRLSRQSAVELMTRKRLNHKSHLLSSVMHDLRTPLSVLMLSLETLQDDKIISIEERADLISDMQKEIKLMSRMLEDILTLGKTEAGKLPFRPRLMDLVEISTALIEEIGRMDRSSHRFELRTEKQPFLFPIDELLFRQVIANLLSNAMKYSAEHTLIEIILRKGMQEEALIEIKDCGVGISPEDQKSIFLPYYRGKNSAKQKGLGYGLCIAQSFVTWMGGTISVKSAPGKGSTFVVSLPRP